MTRSGKKWKCNTCKEEKNEKDTYLECDICNEKSGLECTSYSKEVIEYLKGKNVVPNFICNGCKDSLPELRNMLEMNKQQQKLTEDVAQHDTRITKTEVQIEDLTLKLANKEIQLDQMNTRLATLEAKMIDTKEVESIAQKCFKSSDFPPIIEVRRNQAITEQKLEEVIKSQHEGNEEAQRREDIKNSLVVYGVEEKEENKTEQMKADFNTIKELYRNRVPISSNDLLQVTRAGPHKENQIRPIKIKFASMSKKLEVLRNNKSLILYGGDDECELEFCHDEEKHKHIYVTTDKTKQQREEEKLLRQELKRRKATEPDLIIRNGKIMKKAASHARWSEVAQDGL